MLYAAISVPIYIYFFLIITRRKVNSKYMKYPSNTGG